MDDLINVMIVDDSPVQRSLLNFILSKDEKIAVKCIERSGFDALESLKEHKIDIILMDINMPEMSGFIASKKILENYSIPIIIISATWDIEDAKQIIKSMELGVVATLKKPDGICSERFERDSKMLIQAVKDYSEIKVVRRYKVKKSSNEDIFDRINLKNDNFEVVFIGSSAGGPPALKDILCILDEDFDYPVVVAQHMTDGFSQIFANWLNNESKLKVKLAKTSDRLEKGTVYIIPSDSILDLDENLKIVLRALDKDDIILTNISGSFKNIIKTFKNKVIGIILSGMGKDGVDQLKALHDLGGTTVAQDEKSCVVYGMPFEAVALKAVDYQMDPVKIGYFLKNLKPKRG